MKGRERERGGGAGHVVCFGHFKGRYTFENSVIERVREGGGRVWLIGLPENGNPFMQPKLFLPNAFFLLNLFRFLSLSS